MSSAWTYRGKRVIVPPTADIPFEYRPGSRYDHIVPILLEETPLWKPGEDPIETLTDIWPPVSEIVVPIQGRPVRWGKHRGHRARRVQLSPFVETPCSRTSCFTIELIGSPEEPTLVRAYPGDYIPPLPWQRSATWAYGGSDACITFWKTHAYVYRASLMQPGSETSTPPNWFVS